MPTPATAAARASAASKWRPSVVLRPMNTGGPMNTAGPTNVAHPNAKAPGCLAFLCVCHACRSCLCASLCQAIFTHKPSHVLAGVCRRWSNQQRKSKSKHKCLHHRIGTPERYLVACPVAQGCTPESVSLFMLPPLSTARRHRRRQNDLRIGSILLTRPDRVQARHLVVGPRKVRPVLAPLTCVLFMFSTSAYGRDPRD
jgi:hypothetical protein